jgi:rfaE bifunctional protein kinase chain/domain
MLTRERLQQLLGHFPRLTIGLVGDLFLDRYLDIEPGVREMSIETGLEAYQVARVRNSPGALGTIINNLAALGVGQLVPLAVIGDDGEAYDLLKQLARLPVDTTHVVRDPLRQTPTYTKPLKRDAGGTWRELNRLDLRTRGPLRPETQAEVLQRLPTVLREADGLIVLDQVSEDDWGVVSSAVRERLVELAARTDKPMIIDSRAHIGAFRCGILKPNRSECLKAVGLEPAAHERLPQAVTSLCQRTGQPVFCTLGEAGMLLARPQHEPCLLPAHPVSGPTDSVGAGDSATAGITAALLSGASYEEAGAVGNLVASITIRQLGTTGTATPEQVVARWDEVQGYR